MNIDTDDIKKQAQWEVELEAFETLVQIEKRRLLEKKSFFPWRIQIINTNKGTENGNIN